MSAASQQVKSLNPLQQEQEQDDVELQIKLEELQELVKEQPVAMLTTSRSDGSLVSRAMQSRHLPGQPATRFFFISNNVSQKHEEIGQDHHVNVSFYNSNTRSWISVSGRCTQSQDRELLDALWSVDLRAWLGVVDDKYDASASDPRMTALVVDTDSLLYSKSTANHKTREQEINKGKIHGLIPHVAKIRKIDSSEHLPPVQLRVSEE